MAKKYWKAARRPLAIGGVLTAQMVQAIQRPDLESLTDQDPSGTFGDPALPRLRMIALGDSTITAPGVEPLDDAWVRRTAIHLSDRYYVELVSVAIGGSRISDVRDGQVHRAIVLGADLAVLSVGGNDALRGTPVSRFEASYDQVVRTMIEAFPAVAVCGVGDLGAIPRLPALAQGVARVRGRAIDHAIGRVAFRYGVPKSRAWGPEYASFEHEPALWAGDLFHASADGHAIYADATNPLVDEALRRARFSPS
ncbi:MAG: GDSL-type esterase/lipase family protein [Acidimicrobiia bacterium]|jgi:lysophospholipase L1-like esterase